MCVLILVQIKDSIIFNEKKEVQTSNKRQTAYIYIYIYCKEILRYFQNDFCAENIHTRNIKYHSNI